MPLKRRMKISDITDINYEKLNRLNASQLRDIVDDAIYYTTQRTVRTSISYQKKLEKYNNYPKPVAYSEGRPYKLYEGSKESISAQGRRDYYTNMLKLDQIQKGSETEINELKHLFVQYRNFLRTETSTMTGWEQNISNIINKISEKSGVRIKRADYDKFWNVVNEISEGYKLSAVNSNYELYRTVNEYLVDDRWKNLTPDELAAQIEQRYHNLMMYGNEEGIEDEEFSDDDDDKFPLGRR